MGIHYNGKDPLMSIVSDGLIFYVHPALKASYSGFGNDVYDLVDGHLCTMRGTNMHVAGETFVFNGSDDYIDLNRTYIDDGTYTLSSSTDDYTLEAWIYVETSQGTTTNADSIIGSQSDYGVGMQVGTSSSLPRVNHGARNTSNFYSSTLVYSTWYHVLWAHDHGDASKVYINGVLDTTSSGSSYDIASTSWSDMSIGHSGSRVSGYFDGKMGPIRVYNRALTATEVLRNFNASKARYGL
jgi:hypothetical protein